MAIMITTVRAGDVLFMALNGMAIIPPRKPIIVIILKSIKSVGKSGLKKYLPSANNFFKIYLQGKIACNLLVYILLT